MFQLIHLFMHLLLSPTSGSKPWFVKVPAFAPWTIFGFSKSSCLDDSFGLSSKHSGDKDGMISFQLYLPPQISLAACQDVFLLTLFVSKSEPKFNLGRLGFVLKHKCRQDFNYFFFVSVSTLLEMFINLFFMWQWWSI